MYKKLSLRYENLKIEDMLYSYFEDVILGDIHVYEMKTENYLISILKDELINLQIIDNNSRILFNGFIDPKELNLKIEIGG